MRLTWFVVGEGWGKGEGGRERGREEGGRRKGRGGRGGKGRREIGRDGGEDEDTQQRWNDFISGSLADMNKKNETNLVCSWGGRREGGKGGKGRREIGRGEGE